VDDQFNLIPEENGEPRDGLDEEIGGTFSLINFILQFISFFASLLIKVITDFTKIFNKK